MTKRTIIPLAVMVALLTPASAAAKGISAAKVCGAQECVEVTDDELALLLAGGGPSVSGPERGRPWYRTTLAVSAHDPNSPEPADRERVVEHFSLAAVPLARLLRGEDGTWMKMSHRSVGAYSKLTAGIRARPARTLTDVGAQAALPEARVDEVVEPPPATEPERAAGASTGWIAWLVGGLLAAGAAGLIVVLRGRVSRWNLRRSS